jgi:hypothetical protein
LREVLFSGCWQLGMIKKTKDLAAKSIPATRGKKNSNNNTSDRIAFNVAKKNSSRMLYGAKYPGNPIYYWQFPVIKSQQDSNLVWSLGRVANVLNERNPDFWL